MLDSAGISLFEPFYPDLAIKRGLDQIQLGFIFAIYPLGSILAALVGGKMMKFWGRKKLMFSGLLILISTNLVQGLLIYVKQQTMFFWISIIGRTIQGVGCGLFSCTVYAYIPILFPDSIQQKISMVEVSIGIGYIIGPLIGTLLYMVAGYIFPFLFCSIMYTLSMPLSMKLLPSDASVNEQQQEDEQPLSIRKYINNLEMVLTLSLVTISYMCYGFIIPFLPQHLHAYGIQGEYVGFFFTICSLSYMLGAIVYERLPKHVDLKVWIVMGTFMNILSLLLVGPEQYTYLPNSLITVCIGLFIMGIGCSILLIPTLPQLIIIADKIFPNEHQKVTDMSSGFFSSSTYLSGLISPNLGGFLVKSYGFNRACTILALIILVNCLIYGLFANGFVAFKSLCISYQDENDNQALLLEKQCDQEIKLDPKQQISNQDLDCVKSSGQNDRVNGISLE